MADHGKATSQRSASQPKILNFKPHSKNTLQAFFDVQLVSGLIIRGATLHVKNQKYWVGLPGKPIIGKNGEKTWVNFLDFADIEARDRFQGAVLPVAVEALEASDA